MSNYYPTALSRPAPDYQGGRARYVPFNTRRALPRVPTRYPSAPRLPAIPPELEPVIADARVASRFTRFLPEIGAGIAAATAGWLIWQNTYDENRVLNQGAHGWTFQAGCTGSPGPLFIKPTFSFTYSASGGPVTPGPWSRDIYYINEYCGPRPDSDVGGPNPFTDASGNWAMAVGYIDPLLGVVKYAGHWYKVSPYKSGTFGDAVAAEGLTWEDGFAPEFRPTVAPTPLPPGMPEWWPGVQPGVVPIGTPRPLPTPVPYPVVPKVPPRVDPHDPYGQPSSGPAPNPPPVASPPLARPPGRGTRETKRRFSRGGVISTIVGEITERLDDLSCATRALPKRFRPKPVWVPGEPRYNGATRRGKPPGQTNWRWTPKGWVHEVGHYRAPDPVEQFRAVYDHIDDLDVEKFIECWVFQGKSDQLIGTLSRDARRRGLGDHAGPAL